MGNERNLKKELDELGIVAMEGAGCGSPESAFAAIDAIREHNKKFPVNELISAIESIRKEASENEQGEN